MDKDMACESCNETSYHFNNATKSVEKALEYITADEYAYARGILQDAATSILKAYRCINNAVSFTETELEIAHMNELRADDKSAIREEGIDQSICQYVTPDILQCTLFVNTFVKKRAAKTVFTSAFCDGLSANVARACAGQKPFEKALCLFVSHVTTDNRGVVPYYDNDNLAIKSIIDSIIPAVCPDDAIRYIDNMYFTQVDTSNFTEVFVIRDGHFGEWLSLFSAYDFAKNFRKID